MSGVRSVWPVSGILAYFTALGCMLTYTDTRVTHPTCVLAGGACRYPDGAWNDAIVISGKAPCDMFC